MRLEFGLLWIDKISHVTIGGHAHQTRFSPTMAQVQQQLQLVVVVLQPGRQIPQRSMHVQILMMMMSNDNNNNNNSGDGGMRV